MHQIVRCVVLALFTITAMTVPAHAESMTPGCGKALELAGPNRVELESALAQASPALRPHLEWLIAHMPEADLRTVKGGFLVLDAQQALDAWQSSPWRAQVSEDLFRDAILPYACVDETREPWRERLRAIALQLVGDRTSLAAAATAVNRGLWPVVKVQYSTKRRKANQSPSESMETGLASCTGLSILLVDACRSVGIPARFVGVPMWMDGSGNHSWVEVWDGSAWRFTGAAEATGESLDQGWFTARAAEQSSDDPQHGIYAVTWQDSPLAFPMVWNAAGPVSRARDVTGRYRTLSTAVPAGQVRVYITVVRDEQRTAEPVVVSDAHGRELGRGTTKDERFDANDHFSLLVPEGTAVLVSVNGGEATMSMTATKDPTTAHFVLKSSALPAPGAVGDDAQGAADDPRPSADDSKRSAGGTADKSLTKAAAEKLKRSLWSAYASKNKKAAKAELESGALQADGATMPIWFAIHGAKPKGGRSLWISMHGGGGAPKEVNDQQWENQKHLYDMPGKGFVAGEGVYVAPRAPTDTWNLWHQSHIDALFAKLIRDMILVHDVNPDRVYITGYSAGGDGTYQLAPRMADWFAGAGMMAGHPNETQPDGLRNLAFTLHVGGDDGNFNRNGIAREWSTRLDELAAKDPGGYPHFVKVHEGKGHWMDREDAEGIVWMSEHTRVDRPTKIVWLQDDVTHDRFYWLKVSAPKQGSRVVVTRTGNTITIESWRDLSELTIRLDDTMVDLDEPVVVRTPTTVLHDGPVARSRKVMETTLAERGDPTGIYPAELTVTLPATTSDPAP
ncbi:MAG: polyhydroxyalkanoate depolymerase [Phycisphaerae bacterium]|nr:polyhydroxyalkanoate depolymerase [Phycisphaerae bacterium]